MNSYEEEIMKTVLEGSVLTQHDRLSVLSIVDNLQDEVDAWKQIAEGLNHDPRCALHPKSGSGWLCQRCRLDEAKNILRECAETLSDENIRQENDVDGLVNSIHKALAHRSRLAK